ncbi:SIR2 family protein [Vibrio campbellii]|uniref:SIR2 family protein n=1 Tax=Vibrio campbellii TaxID=680 RepID=UPI000CD35876|nr:SIR2 family protein [Vibrio campbellii]AUV88417.1 SIR2 family protein [Vibrio campbellii]
MITTYNFIKIRGLKMQFDAMAVKTVQQKYDIEKILHSINSGKAIMFTGAGFSFGAETVSGAEPLGAKQLSHCLCDSLGIAKNDNLMFVSDFFMAKKPKSDLISLLKDNYTLSSTSKSHGIICSLPWRRFYTTNYDLSIELASQKSGKIIETVDLQHPVRDYYQRHNFCVHLNGSINSLTEDSLENSFKLSSSSYTSPESFVTSDWFYPFKRDLDRASAIVFVGYSMYDIDIQKILFNDDHLIAKTYFITLPDPGMELEFTLSKFGTIVPIGTDGFAEEIEKFIEQNPAELESHSLESLKLYELGNTEPNVRDAQIETMLMYGDVSDDSIDSCVLGHIDVPFLIPRKQIEEISSNLDKDKNVIIYGALGNGKSILLKELRCQLTSSGHHVYEISDLDGDYIGDLDYLAKHSNKSILLVDDYEQYIDVIKHLSATDNQKILIVATARIADHEFYRDRLLEWKFNFAEVNIDLLQEEERNHFIDIIDNLGLWGENAGFTHAQKLRYLQVKNDNQISTALLSLLDSPNIKSKISTLVNKLKTNKEHESTLFTICLCKIIGVNANRALVSELSGNDAIYDPLFTTMKEFREIFKIFNGEVQSASSLFCICLVKEHFSASYITASLLSIAGRLDRLSGRDATQTRVFKSMLKFSFVERILPKTTKVGNLIRYYSDLKLEVKWLNRDPHFWLQYAMSLIAYKDFNKAQQFLDQAYALAKNKKDYHTDNIDTQQARLWLMECNYISDGNKVHGKFVEAHRLLGYLENNIFKFRQLSRYREFYDNNFLKLSKNNKRAFLDSCKQVLNSIQELDENAHYSVQQLERTQSILRSIIEQ